MHRSFLRIILVVLFLFISIISAWAVSDWIYGIHWYGDVASNDVEAMSDGKGIWVLDQVLPDGPAWEQADWKRDNVFSAVVGKGHTIICRIHPNWGLAVPSPLDDTTIANFAAQCKSAAQSLSDYVHIWHLGNEMNILNEWGGAQLSPTDYTRVYRAVRTAIHEVTSSLGEQVVCVGPVSPGAIIPGVRWMSGSDYLTGMCTDLTPAEVDGFCIHAYGAGGSAAVAVSDFASGYQSQLAILDTNGYGDKPVYITEWNRHTPSQAYEAVSAQFIYQAFDNLNTWNQTPGNHNIVCACWFVYPDDPGWDDYSILAYKSAGGTKDDDMWAAFQYAAQQDYAAGAGGGGVDPGINGGFFNEDFGDSSLDTSAPEPAWVSSVSGGENVSLSGGSLILKGNGVTDSYGGIQNTGYYYDDFIVKSKMTFADTATLHPTSAEANTDIRFRERTEGYSLTFDGLLNKINLRRVGPWSVIQEVNHTINNGDTFYIEIVCNGPSIQIKIGSADGSSDIVNWSISNSDYDSGVFRIHAYMAEEVSYDYFYVLPFSDVDCWSLYD